MVDHNWQFDRVVHTNHFAPIWVEQLRPLLVWRMVSQSFYQIGTYMYLRLSRVRWRRTLWMYQILCLHTKKSSDRINCCLPDNNCCLPDNYYCLSDNYCCLPDNHCFLSDFCYVRVCIFSWAKEVLCALFRMFKILIKNWICSSRG